MAPESQLCQRCPGRDDSIVMSGGSIGVREEGGGGVVGVYVEPGIRGCLKISAPDQSREVAV